METSIEWSLNFLGCMAVVFEHWRPTTAARNHFYLPYDWFYWSIVVCKQCVWKQDRKSDEWSSAVSRHKEFLVPASRRQWHSVRPKFHPFMFWEKYHSLNLRLSESACHTCPIAALKTRSIVNGVPFIFVFYEEHVSSSLKLKTFLYSKTVLLSREPTGWQNIDDRGFGCCFNKSHNRHTFE